VEPAETATWSYPDSLDALAAAPGFHRLLLENDDVRVLETRIGPGETVPVHTHRWPSILYVLETAHFVRRDDRGSVLGDTRAAGTLPEQGVVVWIAAMPPHTVENTGDSVIRLLNVELKRGRR
jgi:mannose-6-phosphate isomerase-like protein (cupin superfamily)